MGAADIPYHRPRCNGAAVGRAVRRGVVALAICLAWLAGDGLTLAAQTPTDGRARVGDMAPDFTLQTFGGEPYRLSEHLSKRPVLLVFWSFFCFPCQKELPDLQDTLTELGPDLLTVVGISLDGPRFSEKVIPFAEKNRIKFPLLYDRETQDFFEVAERYGVVGTPTSFLLDTTGRIRLIHLGRLNRDLLVACLSAAKDQSFCAEIVKPKDAAAGTSAGQ